MQLLAPILATAVPTFCYTLLIWWLDRYEKEPWPLLLAAFGWGSLPAILLALLFEVVLARPLSSTSLGPGLTTWALAPVVEEIVKAAALVTLFVFARREFDGPLDGIVYGALIGFGFSMTENLFFFLGNPAEFGTLFWLRSVFFGLNHAFFTSIVGISLGAVRNAPKRWLGYAAFGGGLLTAIGFHALHNFAVGYQLPGLLLSWITQSSGVLGVLAVATLAWRQERSWIEEGLYEEVALGIISQTDYHEAMTLGLRLRSQLATLLAADWHLFQLRWRLHQSMTHLAFCKYQLSLNDPLHCCDDRDQLRSEIVRLRQALARER